MTPFSPQSLKSQPVLTADMERSLLGHAQKSKSNQSARDRLVLSCLPWLVPWISSCYQGKGVPLPDLLAAAVTGVCDAVDRYDLDTRTCRFREYAESLVKKHVGKAFVTEGPRLVSVPANVFWGSCLTSRWEQAQVTERIAPLPGSLAAPNGNPAAMVAEHLDEKARAKRLETLLRYVPPRGRTVIAQRRQGKTFREIGKVMSCSEKTAWDLYRRTLKTLREEAEVRGWRDEE